ncbi:MAG: type II toxin-antitoxin system PemK/MazF family toxin [bacterium]|nr:type II toxin-antitoxin system PemK/MazF family toxin [bacterium]
MNKDFDQWNGEKKKIHMQAGMAYAHPREVWWCALGANIGAETDGKHDNFERPVLVLRVYNTETLLILPITSREKKDEFHCAVKVKFGTVWIKLTQSRVISTYRLLRKVDMIPESAFKKVQIAFSKFI